MRNTVQRVGGLEIEDHSCQIFERDEDRIVAIVPFLIDGLRSGERVILLADAHEQNELFASLRKHGVEAGPFLEGGQIVIIGDLQASSKTDSAGVVQLISSLNYALESAGEKGYPAVRAMLNMAHACSLLSCDDDSILINIARLEAFISGSRCVALCQYDRRQFSPEIIQSVLEIHPLMVIGDEIFENPHTVPPEALLEPDPAQFRLDRYIESITRQKHREEDLTERNEMEDRLSEREERLRLAMDATGLGIWDWDLIGDNITWSGRLDEHLGHVQGSLKQARGSFLKMVHPFDREQVDLAIEQSLKGGIDCETEFRLLTADGEVRWISVNCKAFFDSEGRPIRMIGVERDITSRKRAEEKLQQSEARFKGIFESSPIGIEVYSADGSLIHINKACQDIFGVMDNEEVLGFKLLDDPNLPLDARTLLVNGSMVKYETAFDFEKVKELGLYRTSRSGTIYIYVIISPLFLKGSCNPSNYLVQVQDVTERKDAERNLIASENKFSAAFQISPDPLAITDIASGKIIDINKSYEEATGFYRSELIGRYIKDFDIWENPGQRDDVISLLFEQNEVRDYPVKIRTKSGDIRDMLFSARFISIADRSYLLSQAHDITEKKKLEESLKKRSEQLKAIVEERTDQLKKAERLATIGETSAMIGHDLRNPLQAVYCMIYLARERLNSGIIALPEGQMGLDDILDSIEDSADYMNKIVSDIQDYARTTSLNLVRTDISFFMRETLSTINIPDNVNVTFAIDKDLHELSIDMDKMKRTIINLVTNAINALPEGGSISISVSKKDNLAKISVKDTGTGIAEEILPKLFLPLFTTRSRGMGLGLSVCKRMVDAMGGNIAINSKVGQGTEAIIEIPMR